VAPQLAMQDRAIRPVNMQAQPDTNDYLVAHQELSPSTDINGGATYIRTVSYGRDFPPDISKKTQNNPNEK
jgi:sigma-E factor negative regulatory protein RseA